MNLSAGLFYSAQIMMPILMLLALGYYLRKSAFLDHHLISGLNGLVYYYGLPALLFFSVIKSKVYLGEQWLFILSGYLSVFILYLMATFIAKKYFIASDRGVFVQGFYRSNMAIVGLALIQLIYPPEIFAIGALFAGSVALLLNSLAVVCLTQHQENHGGLNWSLFLNILKNPSIMAIILALILKALDYRPPMMIIRFGDYLSDLTLPIALLCAGASLDFRVLFHTGRLVIGAGLGKTIIAPFIFVLCGYFLGFRGEYLGILFLLGASPSASAGYIMAKALPNNNFIAAANMIAFTNLVSLFIIGIGLAFFKPLGWL